MWALTGCQVPWVIGVTGGIALPRAFLHVVEKVSAIGVSERMVDPGAGLATALVAAPAGNQLTAATLDVSQERGVAATHIVPAGAVRGSVTCDWGVAKVWRCRAVGALPDENVATGCANCSCSGWFAGTVRKWSTRCAVGAVRVSCMRWVLPVSQAFHPGRFRTTSTVSVSPAWIFLLGQI